MQKTYEGQSAFSFVHERIVLDWSCPNCKSLNVTMEEDEEFRNARWCDGDITTHDTYGKWTCHDCGKVERGCDMIQHEVSRERIEAPKKPVVVRKSIFDR